ncbi:dTDP-4-dehydrorhamnose reductase [Pseudazoarcus pumilus]|uniref:dTDP-4-dehydrorhamnose reductase n=1 Tax=Pseudazoarcus pumilus TaxID=2067960 RepID=A0A2I6S2T0_9RHOO|nr:dTDP-4-dehydrorhamnose reductase [Pseudazoarcus pumilus]AUN93574.1 dTDP-4-dehydrorhamnose reductase [Pseudazoarcus pumilus]
MKLLVTGCSGQLGFELARSLMPLGEVVALDRAACDLADADAVAALAAHGADVIVNAAAYTAVDRAESEIALAQRINAQAPGELAVIARETGALLVHFSTDYVFDGSGDVPWRETDAPAPVNEYGRGKLAGERAIAAAACDHLIFRTSWVFAARGANFVRSMLRLGAERERLTIVDDQIGAPCWARNLADATAHAVRQAQAERAHQGFESGVFHLTSAGETSWCGFARAVFELARERLPDIALRVAEVAPIATEDYPTPAARPKNSRLDGAAFRARFGLEMPHWRDALARCIDELPAG